MIEFAVGIICGAIAIEIYNGCERKRERFRQEREKKIMKMGMEKLNAYNATKYALDRVQLQENLNQCTPISVDLLERMNGTCGK